ncbi:MAG: hypothetical protein HY254_22310 [Burkholderiales bacterium]|nr:hypothetical protein [Burkholderiales bacterium]
MKCHFFYHDDSTAYCYPRFTHTADGMLLHAGIGASEYFAANEARPGASLFHLPDYRELILQQRLPCFQVLAANSAKLATEYFYDR